MDEQLFDKHYGKVADLPVFIDILAIVGDPKVAFKMFMYLESSLTWNTTCLNCARMLDSCYAADAAREQAEDALAVCQSLMTHME